MSRKTDKQALHAANPVRGEGFPVLVLDVRNGVSNPPRLGFGKMHWHDDLQFIVVAQGVVFVDVAGVRIECGKGQGVLLNSRVPHRVLDGKENLRTSFVFPPKLLGFFSGSDMNAYGVSPYVGSRAQQFMHFDLSERWHIDVLDRLAQARELLVERTPSNVDRYCACAQLVQAWACYISNVVQTPPDRHILASNERIKAFVQFIEEHYADAISLDDIAGAGSVSKAECARCFKEMLQTTPYAYLLDFRISKAIELMRSGTMTATAIAGAAGFGSPSHFSTAFKKALGMTPSAYQAAIKSNKRNASETTTAQ